MQVAVKAMNRPTARRRSIDYNPLFFMELAPYGRF
jgi:hypothetical protein